MPKIKHFNLELKDCKGLTKLNLSKAVHKLKVQKDS